MTLHEGREISERSLQMYRSNINVMEQKRAVIGKSWYFSLLAEIDELQQKLSALETILTRDNDNITEDEKQEEREPTSIMQHRLALLNEQRLKYDAEGNSIRITKETEDAHQKIDHIQQFLSTANQEIAELENAIIPELTSLLHNSCDNHMRRLVLACMLYFQHIEPDELNNALQPLGIVMSKTLIETLSDERITHRWHDISSILEYIEQINPLNDPNLTDTSIHDNNNFLTLTLDDTSRAESKKLARALIIALDRSDNSKRQSITKYLCKVDLITAFRFTYLLPQDYIQATESIVIEISAIVQLLQRIAGELQEDINSTIELRKSIERRKQVIENQQAHFAYYQAPLSVINGLDLSQKDLELNAHSLRVTEELLSEVNLAIFTLIDI
ncbi:MAG: hypothetical protein ACJ8CR_30705 [Roseiflexaceae bacterium]